MQALQSYINSYFGVVDSNELNAITSKFKPKSIKKGDFLLRTGEVCKELSFIQSGLIRIFVNEEEKEVTQWISTPGYFVTDLSSFIMQDPARFNIQALTDGEIYTITFKDYKSIGNNIPKWHELEKLFLMRCFAIIENRVYSHLSMNAEERYEFFFNQNKELFNQVPLQYLASMLGMTPETFSRIRKKQLK